RGLGAVAGEEDPHVELVAVPFDLFEEPADAAEVVVAVLDPAPDLLGQLPVGDVDVDLAAPGDPEQLLLVPLAGRLPPGLDRAAGERERRIGNDARLVVAQEVPEPPALRTGAERVVEREEERLGTLEGDPAGVAAEALAEAEDRGPHAVAEHLHER